MEFLNSRLIRFTLAVIGGIFYAFLTYLIAMFLKLPDEWGVAATVVVYLFYLSSRLLLLFSGVDSPYYSKKGERPSEPTSGKNSFYITAQWVGKFYHYHDIALFLFLGILSIVFLISIAMDGLRGNPLGSTIQDLWNAVLAIP